jgi:phosphinothricin acetyltransferase
MSVHVRPARRSDVPAIAEIYADAVLHTTASYDESVPPLSARLDWYDANRAHDMPMFVAEREHTVIGWSALTRFRPRIAYRFTCEDSLYVAPDAQGQGVGSMLLPPLIEAARERSYHSILAVIGDAENHASIRVHERAGFARIALLPQIGFKFGRWLDQVWLQLLLT